MYTISMYIISHNYTNNLSLSFTIALSLASHISLTYVSITIYTYTHIHLEYIFIILIMRHHLEELTIISRTLSSSYLGEDIIILKIFCIDHHYCLYRYLITLRTKLITIIIVSGVISLPNYKNRHIHFIMSLIMSSSNL